MSLEIFVAKNYNGGLFRQMVHVESEKKNKAEKLDRLREEVKDIKKHTSVLHR